MVASSNLVARSKIKYLKTPAFPSGSIRKSRFEFSLVVALDVSCNRDNSPTSLNSDRAWPNKSKAARLLGLTGTQLYFWLEKYGLVDSES